MTLGDYGDEFFICFEGTYGVLIQKKIDKTDISRHDEMMLEKKHSVKEEDKIEFIEVAQNGKGSSFGELALIHRRPRAATIV